MQTSEETRAPEQEQILIRFIDFCEKAGHAEYWRKQGCHVDYKFCETHREPYMRYWPRTLEVNHASGSCSFCDKERALESRAREILATESRQRELNLRAEAELPRREAQISAEVEEFLSAQVADWKGLIEEDVRKQHRENIRGDIERDMVTEIIEELRKGV